MKIDEWAYESSRSRNTVRDVAIVIDTEDVGHVTRASPST